MATRQPLYFDYLSHAYSAGLDDAGINALIERWKQDYGDDWNLLELRLLRLCKAIESGSVTLQEALAPGTPPIIRPEATQSAS